MKVHDLQVVQVPVSSLKQHPENPHSADMDALTESIEVNGFYAPIHVQTSTRFIIAGNHRWLYFLEHDLPTIPVIFLDVDDVLAKRIMLADNRIPGLGHDDEAILFELLQDVRAEDENLFGTGYSSEDYEELRTLNVIDPNENELNRTLDGAPADEPTWEITPVEGDGGTCVEFSVWRVDGGVLKPADLNRLRTALGLRRLERDEFEVFSIETWNRRF